MSSFPALRPEIASQVLKLCAFLKFLNICGDGFKTTLLQHRECQLSPGRLLNKHAGREAAPGSGHLGMPGVSRKAPR